MSYSGYTQTLCENGHYIEVDCFCDPSIDCTTCNAKIVWQNNVDTTNDAGDPIDMSLWLRTNAKYEKCNLGHSHLIAEATYYVPEHCLHENTYLNDRNIFVCKDCSNELGR